MSDATRPDDDGDPDRKKTKALIAMLLATVEDRVLQFEVTDVPVEHHPALRKRGYRWDPDDCVWAKEIADVEQFFVEQRWFERHVRMDGPSPRLTATNWRLRRGSI